MEAIPAEVVTNLLTLNRNVPLGAAALDASSATMWYRYRLPSAMLSPESVFASTSYVVTTADDRDEKVSDALPVRARRGFGGRPARLLAHVSRAAGRLPLAPVTIEPDGSRVSAGNSSGAARASVP